MKGSGEQAQHPELEATGSNYAEKRASVLRIFGKLTKWWRGRPEGTQRILVGYVIVLVFFAVFFILAILGSSDLSRILSETSLLLLLSAIAVIPPLVEFLRPVVSTVKVGVLEVSFREIVEQTKVEIQDILTPDELVKTELQFMATDRWADIVRELYRFNESDAEAIRVDLGTPSKRTWKFPNLYFFALLLELRSGVRQILFVQKRDDGCNEFITMCAPRLLRQNLERISPAFGAAASKWKEAQATAILGMQAPDIDFNNALANASQEANFANGPEGHGPWPGYIDGWVEPQGLFRVLGLDVNLCRIQWKEKFTGDDYRAILSCSESYVAVIRDGSLNYVLDRNAVALSVARRTT